jgi:hypothetical protein
MARERQQTQPQAKKTGGNVAPPVPTSPGPSGSARVPDVAARAYEIWQRSGCPNGKDQEHWFQAERELRARQSAS